MMQNRLIRVLAITVTCVTLGACVTGQKSSHNALNAPVLATSNSPPGEAAAGAVELRYPQSPHHDKGPAVGRARRAAEKKPRDPRAWIGLAASYDRLHRFKLANRAYKQAVRIQGETPAIMNNWGYSKLLQGDLKNARKYLNRAFEKDPKNPHVNNNLALLEASSKYRSRRAGA